MSLCTWLDRSFQTASTILGDFLKWHYFGQEAKVYHYYYDLYVFVKKCALFLSILLHLHKYVLKKTQTTDARYLWVLNAAVYLRDINTQFVLLCKIAENSFTV